MITVHIFRAFGTSQLVEVFCLNGTDSFFGTFFLINRCLRMSFITNHVEQNPSGDSSLPISL